MSTRGQDVIPRRSVHDGAMRTSAWTDLEPAGDGGKYRDLDAVGHDRVRAIEVAGVVGADEDVDVTAEGAGLVPQPATHGGVGDGDGVDDGADRHRRRHVDLDAGRSARVRAQGGRQPDRHPQRSTAVLTQSTGGR